MPCSGRLLRHPARKRIGAVLQLARFARGKQRTNNGKVLEDLNECKARSSSPDAIDSTDETPGLVNAV